MVPRSISSMREPHYASQRQRVRPGRRPVDRRIHRQIVFVIADVMLTRNIHVSSHTLAYHRGLALPDSPITYIGANIPPDDGFDLRGVPTEHTSSGYRG